jgi:hypothetical protein
MWLRGSTDGPCRPKCGAKNGVPACNYLMSKGFILDGVKVGFDTEEIDHQCRQAVLGQQLIVQ